MRDWIFFSYIIIWWKWISNQHDTVFAPPYHPSLPPSLPSTTHLSLLPLTPPSYHASLHSSIPPSLPSFLPHQSTHCHMEGHSARPPLFPLRVRPHLKHSPDGTNHRRVLRDRSQCPGVKYVPGLHTRFLHSAPPQGNKPGRLGRTKGIRRESLRSNAWCCMKYYLITTPSPPPHVFTPPLERD